MHLEVRVHLLQLAQLVEVAAQRAGVPGVGDAVDAVGRGVGLVVVGVGVADRALAAGDVAEGVVDVGQLGGRAAGLDVLDVVVAAVDAPLGEVADDLLVPRLGGVVGWAGCWSGSPSRWLLLWLSPWQLVRRWSLSLSPLSHPHRRPR